MPPFADLVHPAASRHGVPAGLVFAVIEAESNFRPDAVSSAGAIGLMQLMPATAAGLGVDPWDPAQNVDGGVRFLRANYDQFGSWELALAAYNAGPGNVQRYGGIPPFAETQRYVPKVLALWRQYGDAPAAGESGGDDAPNNPAPAAAGSNVIVGLGALLVLLALVEDL